MFGGKDTCKILKQIRQTIASENDIPLVVEECHYKGECRGTCPRCEAELEYLERELLKRRSMGKKIVLAGLSAGLSWAPMAVAEGVQSKGRSSSANADTLPEVVIETYYWHNPDCEMLTGVVSRVCTTIRSDSIRVTGMVKDSVGEPIYLAKVRVQGTTREVSTDFDGNYTIYVTLNDTLEFSAVGFKDTVVKVNPDKKSASRIKLDVVLKDEGELEEVVITTGYVSPLKRKKRETTETDSTLSPRPLIRMDEHQSKDKKEDLQQK